MLWNIKFHIRYNWIELEKILYHHQGRKAWMGWTNERMNECEKCRGQSGGSICSKRKNGKVSKREQSRYIILCPYDPNPISLCHSIPPFRISNDRILRSAKGQRNTDFHPGDKSLNCRWFPYSHKRGRDSAWDAERHACSRIAWEKRGKDMRTMNARISARFVRKIAPRGPAVHVPRRDGWTRWERGGLSRRKARREEKLPSRGPFHYVSSLARPHLSPRFSEPKLFSCLSFVPVSSERASLSLPPRSSFSPPLLLLLFISSFFFSFLFFLCAISLPIHRCLGPWKGSRLRQLERRARRGRKEGTAAEAFSNRIPHCRLGNSRRIEITHYPVMSDAFTSTRGCTRRRARVRAYFLLAYTPVRIAYTRPRNDVTFTWSSSLPSLDLCANGVTGFPIL